MTDVTCQVSGSTCGRCQDKNLTCPEWKGVGDYGPYQIKNGTYYYHFKFGLVESFLFLSDEQIAELETVASNHFSRMHSLTIRVKKSAGGIR